MQAGRMQPLGMVVGGANGIGAACCRLMAARGWRVIVADRDFAAGTALAQEISGEAIHLDVTDAAGVAEAAAPFADPARRLDGLVISSGTFQENVPVADSDPAGVERILGVNLAGAHHVLRHFGLAMARTGGGSIVAVASVVGHVSTPLNLYGPSKAGLINMARSFAGEFGRSGVRVNSVSPGITLVPRVRERIEAGTRYPPDLMDQMALGRCVEPAEVAEAIEFLLSPRASAITGTDLVVDCGWMAGGLWPAYGGLRPPQEQG